MKSKFTAVQRAGLLKEMRAARAPKFEIAYVKKMWPGAAKPGGPRRKGKR